MANTIYVFDIVSFSGMGSRYEFQLLEWSLNPIRKQLVNLTGRHVFIKVIVIVAYKVDNWVRLFPTENFPITFQHYESYQVGMLNQNHLDFSKFYH